MASTFTYNVPTSPTAESNDTFINKREYSLKECIPLLANTKDDLWNANKCPNDGCYCQPYVSGDIIYLQFNKTKSLKNYDYIIPELVNDGDDTHISVPGAMIIQEGTDDQDNEYINLIINTSAIAGKCFYVRLNAYACPDLSSDEYEACLIDHQADGTSLQDAILACLEEHCPNPDHFITEPYCEDATCRAKTVQIQGSYPKYDCDDRYYATFSGGGTNSFKPSLRIYGTIEWYDHTTEETTVDRQRTRARGIDKYRLRSQKIPPYVARQIALILDSQKTFVDGIEYKGGTKMSKDFDEGGSWMLTVDLFRECSENNFACTT